MRIPGVATARGAGAEIGEPGQLTGFAMPADEDWIKL
jgi:hypothetical protein